MHAHRFFFYLVLASICSTEPTRSQPPSSSYASNTAVDEHHLAALELIEAFHMRDALLSNKEPGLEKAKQQMLAANPKYSPQFAEEWKRRMSDQYPLDAFVSVSVTTYEKYLTTEELKALAATARTSGSASPTPLPAALQEKLGANMTTILSEITGGCAQIGSKLGGDIGGQIAKEHPEWMGVQ